MYHVFDMLDSYVFIFETEEAVRTWIEDQEFDEADLEDIWIIKGEEWNYASPSSN